MFVWISFKAEKILICRHIAQNNGRSCKYQGEQRSSLSVKLRNHVDSQSGKKHQKGNDQWQKATTPGRFGHDRAGGTAMVTESVFVLDIGAASGAKHHNHLVSKDNIFFVTAQPILHKCRENVMIAQRRDAMRDIPFFDTEFGVASLVLKEIPYQAAAYITVLDAWEPEKLIEECRKFCVMCGANRVYATGHPCLEIRPLYTAMWEMRRSMDGFPDTDGALWPVQEQTLEQWRNIYNEKIRRLPNAAWMTEKEGRQMLAKGDGYFVHRGEKLLGIGRASGEQIGWVASVERGAGRDVV